MLSDNLSIKKRVIMGIASTALFYFLLFLFTKYSVAQPLNFPATPPVTPPTTPPTTITPTPADEGKATGGVTAQFGGKLIKLSFNAQGENGDVKGHVTYSDNRGDKFKGDVDVCYEQQGNVAVFAGTIDGKRNILGIEEYFYMEVEDNGEGSSSSPDRVRVNTFLAAPGDCDFSGVLPAKVVRGNLQVH